MQPLRPDWSGAAGSDNHATVGRFEVGGQGAWTSPMSGVVGDATGSDSASMLASVTCQLWSKRVVRSSQRAVGPLAKSSKTGAVVHEKDQTRSRWETHAQEA